MNFGVPAQIAGVDGCKAGWIAVTATLESFGKPEVKVFTSVAALIAELAPKSLIAIDMPIGLPERAIRGGREPDWAARQFLGRQRASIFPVPSRRTVYACANGYPPLCIIAQDTSDPPRKPSRQIFGILHRIRQVDEILRQQPELGERVFEVHPEVSFQVINSDEPLPERKKVKGRINPNGMQLRKKLLEKEAFPARSWIRLHRAGPAWMTFTMLARAPGAPSEFYCEKSGCSLGRFQWTRRDWSRRSGLKAS